MSNGTGRIGRRALIGGLAGLAAGCSSVKLRSPISLRSPIVETSASSGMPPLANTPEIEAFLDDVQLRTFAYFWWTTEPRRGLAPDRFPTLNFASIAAMGFALTAFVIGVERGYVPRQQAATRTLAMLRFLAATEQGAKPKDMIGYQGFFYHFLSLKTGTRFQQTELSTVDTALLMAGVLLAQTYYDRPEEAEIRTLADKLYSQVDWRWAMTRAPVVALGWTPERGFIPYDWVAYNEAMLVYVLALGAPIYGLPRESWDAWSVRLATFWTDSGSLSMLRFPPLFGHQYSHVWIDFRKIQDDFMRSKGSDYFENSRRATIAQRNYALANPLGWRGYDANLWGLTACDGPGDVTIDINGEQRTFHSYLARGVGAVDDGTLAPTAPGGSIPFAPEICIPALMAMRDRYGDHLYGTYGFYDAFNPTFQAVGKAQNGRVIPGQGWFDTDWLGIDQGPILAMIENYRTGLIWSIMRRNPYIRAGLTKAGFTGGWLSAA
ncbi:glucoamylase family protein [Sphingomonas oligoaromativorans]|jgi:hypothetical protein|uniref:glucoamylase family protein n=1 Tax=Sphingomonas oligoaromativorans TaxID=575322 RepID=UPI00141EDCCB|nr:glucoamylase family protein [Sphingomonas oligoaromativorans]NIJ33298.1 hypothetical protein [Sphingomonas oligoaromativorans]